MEERYSQSGLSSLNTSHVLVNQTMGKVKFTNVGFKYISCSSYSHQSNYYHQSVCGLNTSHVLVNPRYAAGSVLVSSLNTSHVLVNRGKAMVKRYIIWFKYISCSS